MDQLKLLIFIVVISTTVYLMRKEKKGLIEGQVLNDEFTGKQKAITWVLCFLNPIIAGAIFYYGWKKSLPIKAKQANQISLWAFLILIIVGVISSVLTTK